MARRRRMRLHRILLRRAARVPLVGWVSRDLTKMEDRIVRLSHRVMRRRLPREVRRQADILLADAHSAVAKANDNVERLFNKAHRLMRKKVF